MGNISLLQFISSVTTMHCANEEIENKRLMMCLQQSKCVPFEKDAQQYIFLQGKGAKNV